MGIRPIVSSVNSVTENLSSFLDAWLNPLVQKLPSYIKDSMEFIKMVTSTQIPNNSILVSIDVSSLYTNIPHKDGIAAAVQALQKDADPNPLRPPIQILTEMLNIVLKNNVTDSMETTFSKSKAQLWEQKWPQHMPTYSWAH